MSPTTDTPPRVWSIFHDRALELRTMGRRLRLLTVLAVAQLVGAVVLLALRDVHVATTPLTRFTSVPAPVLWLTAAFMALAWGYLLAGALHAHPVAGVAGLATFGAALIPLGQDVGWHGAPALVRVGALAGIAAVALSSWARRRGSAPDARTIGVVRTALLTGLVAAVYATFAWDASANTVFRFFSFGVADQLMSTSFFLLPVLFLTGAEFAEWAEAIGDRVSYAADRVGSTRLLAGLAAAISVAVLAHVVIAYGTQIPAQVVLFALGGGLIAWRARRARPPTGWPYAVPWAAMALVACAFIGVLLIEVYRTTPGSLHATASAGRVVEPHPVSPLSGVHQLVHRRLDPYRYDPVLVVPFLAWLGVTAAVGLVLGLEPLRRRARDAVLLGAVFVFAFGVLFLLAELRQVLEEVFDGRLGVLYSLRLPGVQAAVALGTLGWLGLLLARGQLARERTGPISDLVVVGGGLQLLAWISHLYKTALLVGARLSIAQAVVILLALSWELIVSGESVTNGHSRAFPRATRVLAFCGYIMLVATAVLFFSSLRAHGSGIRLEPQFESEGWPALGIVQLGVPALLCTAGLRLGAFTPPRRR